MSLVVASEGAAIVRCEGEGSLKSLILAVHESRGTVLEVKPI